MSEGENLDYNYLKEKYLLKNNDNLEAELLEENNDCELYDKIVIDQKDYYENKEGGKYSIQMQTRLEYIKIVVLF